MGPLLDLSLDAFAETGAALGVVFAAEGVSVWWSGSDVMARRIAAERRITMGEVWRLNRIQQEARRAKLDPETVTVASLVAALGGQVRAWRPGA